MKLIIKKATTSKIIQIFIQNSSLTTGAGLTGLVYNSASLTAYYIKVGDASATAIALADATVGTWTSSGFKEVDATNMPGVYEIGIPNACLTTVAQVVIMLKGAANMAPVVLEIQLDDNIVKDVYDRIGAPTGASIAADLVVIDNFVDDLEGRLTALRAGYLDNLSSGVVALEGTLTQMKQKVAGTYDRETDSLEALRDRGDAAWITATGFATAVVCTEARLAELDAANIPTDVSNVGKKVDRNLALLM